MADNDPRRRDDEVSILQRTSLMTTEILRFAAAEFTRIGDALDKVEVPRTNMDGEKLSASQRIDMLIGAYNALAQSYRGNRL